MKRDHLHLDDTPAKIRSIALPFPPLSPCRGRSDTFGSRGLPAVVNVKHGTRLIRTGQTITVDGDEGVVVLGGSNTP